MSEIEKLYELAEVEKKRMCEWTCKGSEHCSTNCEHYESTKEYYPPFTAEKQLELIKLLSEREIYINHAEGKYFIFTMNIGGSECSKDFDTSLAKYINLIWQDLTEEERNSIKEILQG